MAVERAGGRRPAASRAGARGAPALRAQILEEAMRLAAESGWHDLRLRLVADRLGVPLAAILGEYRDADAIADAWFGRALAAMLAPPPPGFAALPASRRAEVALMRWFAAQDAHRAVAGQMIREKLWPSHPHHWVPMVFSLSRLVHWLREAAMLDGGGLRRQAEEVGLTLVVLRSLPVWLADETLDAARTRVFLARNLRWLDRLLRG